MAEQRHLGAGEALLDHDRAPGRPEGGAGQLGPDVGGRLVDESVTSTPLPAASPSVFTTYGGARVARKASAASSSPAKVPGEAGRGHAGRHEQLLHPRLRALQPGAVGARAEHAARPGPGAGRPGRRPAAPRGRSRRGRPRSPRAARRSSRGSPGCPASPRRRPCGRGRRPARAPGPRSRRRRPSTVRAARTARGPARCRRSAPARRPRPRGTRGSREPRGQLVGLGARAQVGAPAGQLDVHRRDVVEHGLVVRHRARASRPSCS